jgi:hypothetical protein
VRELESLRPITAAEAITEADRLDAESARLLAAVRAAEACPREAGRVADSDTVAARDWRNTVVLGTARKAVWGYETIALTYRLRAAALRRIAAQPVGSALASALAEARQRLAYYQSLPR